MIIRRDTSNRRERIVALLREQGSVQIPALAERFRVSTQTLRKDLNFLDIKGICTRSSGGAILRRAGLSPTEQAIEVKRTLFAEEASSLMRGTSGDDSIIRHAAAAATAITEPSGDGRGPVEYRRAMAGVVVARALKSALSRAKGV